MRYLLSATIVGLLLSVSVAQAAPRQQRQSREQTEQLLNAKQPAAPIRSADQINTADRQEKAESTESGTEKVGGGCPAAADCCKSGCCRVRHRCGRWRCCHRVVIVRRGCCGSGCCR